MKDMKKIAAKPEEISQMFGIPQGTLANLRWAKKGPRYFKRPGGRGVFYLLSDVEEWITSQPVLTVDSLPENRQ
jgi:hypothetical protein